MIKYYDGWERKIEKKKIIFCFSEIEKKFEEEKLIFPDWSFCQEIYLRSFRFSGEIFNFETLILLSLTFS